MLILRFQKIVIGIFCVLVVSSFSSLAHAKEPAQRLSKLVIFFSPSCHNCTKAKTEIIPVIEKQFKGKIALEYRDITDVENYKYLLTLREKYNKEIEIVMPVFFFGGGFVNGKGDMKAGLEKLISGSLSKPHMDEDMQEMDLVSRFKSFKPITIIGAGLTDGINPCAFTVIVFFISFLALQGYRKRELVSIGLSFISAVFLTYFLLGLGLFDIFYRLKGFWVVTRVLNIGIGIFSMILGCLAVYDFIKYRKTGSTEGLTLQLPQAVKHQIHSVIGAHHRRTRGSGEQNQRVHMVRLIAAALTTGFLVSLLEAVCTGQLYLPTITFVLKTTSLKLHAIAYLFLYNLMFVVPLVVIFIFALFGVTSEQFSGFLKKHLLGIKILMAVVFFALGLFLIWRA